MDKSLCMANKGSSANEELAYYKGQSAVDCTTPLEVHKNLQERQRVPAVAHVE